MLSEGKFASAVEAEGTIPACSHQWIVESSSETSGKVVCRNCQEVRNFEWPASRALVRRKKPIEL